MAHWQVIVGASNGSGDSWRWKMSAASVRRYPYPTCLLVYGSKWLSNACREVNPAQSMQFLRPNMRRCFHVRPRALAKHTPHDWMEFGKCCPSMANLVLLGGR